MPALLSGQGVHPTTRQLGEQGREGVRPSASGEGTRPNGLTQRTGGRGASRTTGSCGEGTAVMDRGGRGSTPRTELSKDQRRKETRIVEPVGKRRSGRERGSSDHVVWHPSGRRGGARLLDRPIGQGLHRRQPRLRSRTTASRVKGYTNTRLGRAPWR